MNKWLDEQESELTILGYRIKDIPWALGFVMFFVTLILIILRKVLGDSDISWITVLLFPIFMGLLVILAHLPLPKSQRKSSKWPWN